MKYLPLIIRIILSIVLIYFISKETGIATTIFATLVLIYVEISTFKEIIFRRKVNK